MTESQLLRLYTFIQWVKEVLYINSVDIEQANNSRNRSENKITFISSIKNPVKDKSHNLLSWSDNNTGEFLEQEKLDFRTDTNCNYYDHVFESEINRAIKLSEESYEKKWYIKTYLNMDFLKNYQ